jgi:hypothetical protein
MAFGYGAYKLPKENTVDFKGMLEKILKSKITINCDPKNREHSKMNNMKKRSAHS